MYTIMYGRLDMVNYEAYILFILILLTNHIVAKHLKSSRSRNYHFNVIDLT